MAGFDLSDVLAAARGIPGAREDGRWRCVVYLSAYDWMSGWLRASDMAAQSAACKAWLSAHGDARKVETIRNRNAVRNVRAAFDELMRVIENRRADCVVVPDIAVFAPCFSEARFYVEEVLVPMGFRFVDCARGFDTQGGDVRAYFKGLQTEMSDALALHAEHDRLASGGLIRRNVPFGYVFDEDAPCGVRGGLLLVEPRLGIGVHGGERGDVGVREVSLYRLGPPVLGEALLDPSRGLLLALYGGGADVAPRLVADDRRLELRGADALQLRVLGAHPLHLDAERLRGLGPLDDVEFSGEVVRGVQEGDRLVVADALDDAAGHAPERRVVLGQQRVGRLASVTRQHLEAAVWLPTHHGDVCEAVLPDGFREAFDAVLVHGIGDVRRMVLDGRHFDLLDGEPLLRLPVLVEHARQTEAFGDVVYSSHSPSSLPRFS